MARLMHLCCDAFDQSVMPLVSLVDFISQNNNNNNNNDNNNNNKIFYFSSRIIFFFLKKQVNKIKK